MLTFNEFLKKTDFLLESKLDDIKRGLARRHKKETRQELDPAELHDVVVKAKKLGLDLTKTSFNELKNKVDSGVKVLHHNPKTGVTIHKITKKKTAINMYGHGKTEWCVAATGKNNPFEKYGGDGKNSFFTIHHRPPSILRRIFQPYHSVLGIHEYEAGIIRDRNDKEVPVEKVHPDVLKAMSETEGMENSNLQTKNPHFGKEQIINSVSKLPNNTLVKLFVHHKDPDVRASAGKEGNLRDASRFSRAGRTIVR